MKLSRYWSMRQKKIFSWDFFKLNVSENAVIPENRFRSHRAPDRVRWDLQLLGRTLIGCVQSRDVAIA